MKKEFCTYEQSLALNELGFDEDFIGVYDGNEYLKFSELAFSSEIPAPLMQQAFRFFREEYGYWFIIEEVEKSLYNFRIWDVPLENFLRENDIFWGGDYNTYEESEKACLDKLIELAKESKL